MLVQLHWHSDFFFSKVYNFFFLISTDTDQEDPPNVEDPMQELKDAIGRAMPEQIACYHENCQAYEQVKTSK